MLKGLAVYVCLHAISVSLPVTLFTQRSEPGSPSIICYAWVYSNEIVSAERETGNKANLLQTKNAEVGGGLSQIYTMQLLSYADCHMKR